MTSREFIEPEDIREVAVGLGQLWSEHPIEFVRNFGNAVYRVKTASGSAYLRVTPEGHRTKGQIESELQIIEHAASSGVPVSRAVPSRAGELVHAVTANGVVHCACLFAEAKGVYFADQPPSDDARFFFNVGRIMGHLHQSLVAFEPPPAFTRFEWRDDRWYRFAELVPKGEVDAWRLYEELEAWTRQLPTDPSVYGLIHGDFTINNFRIHGDDVTLFDFDASCRHWHAYEVATFLHWFGGKDQTRNRAYECVLDGYAEARQVSARLLEMIPLFGKMRLLYSFLVFAQEWGFSDLTKEQHEYFEVRRRLFRSPPTWPLNSGTLGR